MNIFMKSIYGGIFISLGAFAASMFPKPINGMIFSIGLILIVLAQQKLFTGDILSAKNGITKKVVENWINIYIGNFIGCLTFAYCISHSNYDISSLLQIGETKAELTFYPCFLRGIFCNVLVCSAVFLASISKDIISKIVSIVFPITVFIVCGFEHSVANMFYYTIANTSYINLIPVTLGNIIGGFLIIPLVKNYVEK